MSQSDTGSRGSDSARRVRLIANLVGAVVTAAIGVLFFRGSSLQWVFIGMAVFEVVVGQYVLGRGFREAGTSDPPEGGGV
jgi:hypothetical protein